MRKEARMVWTADMARTVEALLLDMREGGGGLDPVMQEAAAATGGLPIHCDMGGCLVLTSKGEVLQYDPEQRAVLPHVEDRWRELVLVKAARRYDTLAALLPRRPEEAVTCPACGGTGLVARTLDCATCVGKGWTSPRSP